MGALIPTYRIPIPAKIAQDGVNGIKAYGDLTRGRRGHAHGPLDGFVFGCFCNSAANYEGVSTTDRNC